VRIVGRCDVLAEWRRKVRYAPEYAYEFLRWVALHPELHIPPVKELLTRWQRVRGRPALTEIYAREVLNTLVKYLCPQILETGKIALCDHYGVTEWERSMVKEALRRGKLSKCTRIEEETGFYRLECEYEVDGVKGSYLEWSHENGISRCIYVKKEDLDELLSVLS